MTDSGLRRQGSDCRPTTLEQAKFSQDIHFIYLNHGEDATKASAYLEEHDRRLEPALLECSLVLRESC